MLFFVIVGLIIFAFGFVVFRGAPYVPTHSKAREKIIGHAFPTGTIVDLGSGDGTILVEAARLGRRIIGVELNPFLVAITWLRIRRQRHLASVELGDLWWYKLPADTSTVFVFLAGPFMHKLEDYMSQECKRLGHDIRLISYAFEFEKRAPVLRDGPVIVYEFRP